MRTSGLCREAATTSRSDCSAGTDRSRGSGAVDVAGPSSSFVLGFFARGDADVFSVSAMRAMGSSSEDELSSDEVSMALPSLPLNVAPVPAEEDGPLMSDRLLALPFSAAAAARSALACAAR